MSKTSHKTFKTKDVEIFHKFSNQEKIKKISYKNLTNLRKFFILVMIFEELIYWSQIGFFNGLKYKIIFLTEWNHFLSLLLYVLLVIFKFDQNKTEKLSGLFHLVFSAQLNCNVFYWCFIHKEAMLRINNDYLCFLMYIKHVSPVVFILIDFCFNNILLSKKSRKFILPYSIIYTFFNYYITVIVGMRVYDKINYENYKSFVLVFMNFTATFGCAYIALKLQEVKYGLKKIKD